MCKAAGGATGHPILPATAEKFRSEPDIVDSGPSALTFTRTYRSNWASDASRASVGLGQVWTHNHSTVLKATPAAAPTAVTITSSEGYVRTFTKPTGATAWTATNSADTLALLANGTWTYRRADDDSTQSFTANGKLQTSVTRQGWATTYAYNAAGQLATISNGFGRSLALAYNGAGQLASVTVFGNRVIAYGYDAAGRLSSVTYPDAKTRTFAYENPSFPQALTGILDETGARWGTFAYDAQGRAITTELAGATERYQVSYPAAGSASVIDPLGTTRSYSYGTTLGKLAVTAGSLPSGTGESDASSRVQDANGLITSETDFKGVVTTTTWDVARRLPLTVTRAAGTPESQTTTTQWHPTFSLPALITETGRTTAFTYDALGNKLSETTTHTGVTPQKVQTRTWTYTPQSLVATETASNGGVTRYTYDAFGNVLTLTNPVGHVTTYTYDSANRVIGRTAPNGLVTTYTWDARDRLLTQTVGAGIAGAQTTTLTYNPTGTLATLTLPTGLVLSYSYDAAHRLTGWTNNRSESGTFNLDAMGNRVAEQIKNASGAIAWTTVRSVNAINRLAASTEGSDQTRTFGYDANGERTSDTNALNQSTRYGLDSLRRVTAITDAANASASLGYNALDDVTQASDFKGVATGYNRDAQGNALSETTPDAGARNTQYDSLGLPSQITDALGQATTITRDLLGRPTVLTFADGKSTTLTWDASTATLGYLGAFADRSGSTVYERDLFGRVTRKTQNLANGMNGGIGYAYNARGQLQTLTYPSGGALGHVYDATGRLSQLDWNQQPLITQITWNPMGQPTGWTWAFGAAFGASGGIDQPTERRYDTAGRLTEVSLLGVPVLQYQYNPAGRITSLSQLLARPTTPGDPDSTISSDLVSWSVGYDAVGRVQTFDKTSGTTIPSLASASSFSYDANGNRSASSQTRGGVTTARTYSLSANRATGFSQSVGSASTSVAYTHNANGDLIGDGLRTFVYDPEHRLSDVTTGSGEAAPTTRYAHNALGQRVFKTEPLYAPVQGQNAGMLAAFTGFISKLWSPATSDAEKLGYAYLYDEDGTLLGEYGTGGAQSGGAAQYIWLPTASGPLPIVADLGDLRLAVYADHLHTPRGLVLPQVVQAWQWPYGAFGDEQPALVVDKFAGGVMPVGTPAFNLRYAGQYADSESGLFYNGFRTYNPTTGRYTQNDPIGLDGGWNRFGYVSGNPLMYTDPEGLQGRSGGLFYPRGSAISGPPVMAENGGFGSPRSIMNQFTNEPNPSPRLPGDYVGINYPWSMPNLVKVCDVWGPYSEPDPNAGNMCKPPASGGQGPFLSAPGKAPARTCLAWHVEQR